MRKPFLLVYSLLSTLSCSIFRRSRKIGATGVDSKPRPKDRLVLAFAWEPVAVHDMAYKLADAGLASQKEKAVAFS